MVIVNIIVCNIWNFKKVILCNSMLCMGFCVDIVNIIVSYIWNMRGYIIVCYIWDV